MTEKMFVIAVDVQRDFMVADGALYVNGAEALIRPLNDWLAARNPTDTAGVLLTFDTHHADTYAASAEAERFPPHCLHGEPGWDSVIDTARIDPAIPLFTLEKGVFAMWAEPDVVIRDARAADAPAVPRDRFFDALRARGVDRAIVIGVAADYCVRWAVDGLLDRGFAVTVPAAMTRGIVQQIDAVAGTEWAGRAVTIA